MLLPNLPKATEMPITPMSTKMRSVVSRLRPGAIRHLLVASAPHQNLGHRLQPGEDAHRNGQPPGTAVIQPRELGVEDFRARDHVGAQRDQAQQGNNGSRKWPAIDDRDGEPYGSQTGEPPDAFSSYVEST